MSKYKGMVRVWGYVPEEINNEIENMAAKEQRKVANLISLLLQSAVKERLRKRNGKKLHIQDNSTD
jgi:hypothetical protein